MEKNNIEIDFLENTEIAYSAFMITLHPDRDIEGFRLLTSYPLYYGKIPNHYFATELFENIGIIS